MSVALGDSMATTANLLMRVSTFLNLALLTVHTIGLCAVLIITSLLGHHAVPVVMRAGCHDNWHGMMVQKSRGDEHSPKTNSMNSKKSKKSSLP